jgi:hypothetical protein
LRDAVSKIKSDVIVFHTDLMEVGIIDQVKPREQLLADYWSGQTPGAITGRLLVGD